MTQTDVWKLRGELWKWDMEEKQRLLEEHSLEWTKRRNELQATCTEAGGHWWKLKDFGPVGAPISYCAACTATKVGQVDE